ncbi:MAG TPA: glycosyltransferase family 4 protein [Flavobacterium sp.]|nr:glycosyltransferase family 4 protein [Flavobacterium sp.]
MRILQVIDSLHMGGAERIAVNYANALAEKIEFSAITATRKEGALKSQISDNADYLFLNKKRSVDFAAMLRLRSYCKKNKIGFVHAHGTSYFTAFLLKLSYPSVKIVWHEHKGATSSESLTQNKSLWVCSKFFSGIIVVDHLLEKWCVTVLKFKKVIYLPNFTIFSKTDSKATSLKGKAGKRILCLANLRLPKNHNLLLEVAVKVKEKYPEWTFHLVGNDFDDDYSKALKRTIAKENLEETVFIYGLREDTANIIGQADIAVLTSVSEGLPVALLEYGLYKKAVVVTDVGEIPLIINHGKNGFTVPSGNAGLFCDALENLMANPELRVNFGEALHKTIMKNHSRDAVIGQYLEWIKKI